MANIMVAQISQRQCELLQKPATNVFGQSVLLFYETRQVPAIAVFHHDVYVPIRTYTWICLFFPAERSAFVQRENTNFVSDRVCDYADSTARSQAKVLIIYFVLSVNL